MRYIICLPEVLNTIQWILSKEKPCSSSGSENGSIDATFGQITYQMDLTLNGFDDSVKQLSLGREKSNKWGSYRNKIILLPVDSN